MGSFTDIDFSDPHRVNLYRIYLDSKYLQSSLNYLKYVQLDYLLWITNKNEKNKTIYKN
jgi:hypothetical protein